MNEQELKDWLRANLRLSVEYTSYSSNDIEIGLYFAGEDSYRDSFTQEVVHIPNEFQSL